MLLAVVFTAGYFTGGLCALVIIALAIASQRSDELPARVRPISRVDVLTPGAGGSDGDAQL